MEDKIIVEGVCENGYGIIPKSVMQNQNLNIGAKGLYAYFRSFSGGGISCFPSRGKICYDLGISKDTFYKYLNQLIDEGYISTEKYRENGKFTNTTYIIHDVVKKQIEEEPCPKISSPCPKLSDTENSDTAISINNNNSNKEKNNNINIIIKKERFKKPTFEEVDEYCKSRKNNIDPQKFIDYYESVGWIIGKNKPMKDWKACVRTWENNKKKANGNTSLPEWFGKTNDDYESISTPLSEEEKKELDKFFDNFSEDT